jgi:hypothetical protein
MSIVVFRFFILIAFSSQVFALDESFINKLAICDGKKSTLSKEEIYQLKDAKLFPMPGDSFGGFVDRVQNWDRKKELLACPQRSEIRVEAKPPVRTQVVLADLVKQTAALVARDMENQQHLIRNGRICSARLVELERGGRFIEKVEEKDFDSLTGVSAKECMFFVKKFMPEIQRRFRLMRQMMALANPPVKAGKPLEHDRPFSFDLTKSFYPGIWKKNTSSQVAPLTEEEAREALDPNFTISPEGAQHTYYQLLSTTPMLLFFDKKVEAPQFEYAFDELEKQNKMDIESFKKNPPQDMMLLSPYVFAAIEKLPADEVGDACMVLGQIYKNIGIYYEKVPQLAAQMGVLFAVAGGIEGLAAKKFLSNLMGRAGISLTVYSAVVTKDSFQKYSAAVQRCSTVAAEPNLDPEALGLCDFKFADDKYRDGQNQVLASAVLGASLSGYMRLMRPPAN